ncbi:MAG: hypothetical protein H0X38_05125 [Planctomycetes bacterium]|nr:hypothetical protein [Planctomycetota bacterium]
MPVPIPTQQTIAENAAGPRRVQGDAGAAVEQHPLPDQIAADRYLAAKVAMRSQRKGLRITKLLPPGAV